MPKDKPTLDYATPTTARKGQTGRLIIGLLLAFMGLGLAFLGLLIYSSWVG